MVPARRITMRLWKTFRSMFREAPLVVVADFEEFSRDLANVIQALSEVRSMPYFRRNGSALSHLRRARNAVDAVNAAARCKGEIRACAKSLESIRLGVATLRRIGRASANPKAAAFAFQTILTGLSEVSESLPDAAAFTPFLKQCGPSFLTASCERESFQSNRR